MALMEYGLGLIMCPDICFQHGPALHAQLTIKILKKTDNTNVTYFINVVMIPGYFFAEGAHYDCLTALTLQSSTWSRQN